MHLPRVCMLFPVVCIWFVQFVRPFALSQPSEARGQYVRVPCAADRMVTFHGELPPIACSGEGALKLSLSEPPVGFWEGTDSGTRFYSKVSGGACPT